MTTYTQYSNWARVTPGSMSMTLEGDVADALESYEPSDELLQAVCAAYREAINAALPGSVSLHGNDFYGAAYAADCTDQQGYPHDEDGRLDLEAIVDSVDFWEVADPILNPGTVG